MSHANKRVAVKFNGTRVRRNSRRICACKPGTKKEKTGIGASENYSYNDSLHRARLSVMPVIILPAPIPADIFCSKALLLLYCP
jgi:hypothetical protein